MATTNNLDAVLSFLQQMSQNNNKPWFEQHRAGYQAARAAFEAFIDSIIEEFRATDRLEGLKAKDCIARINRDIRFSRDKSPYKTNLSAMVAPGGWKTNAFGYYISIQPNGQSMAAGGLYDPKPEQLARFRQTIERDATGFKRVITEKPFVDAFGGIDGERLKTAPKGYNREHPEIALLQLKQITAIRRFSDAAVLAPDFQAQVNASCRAMRPFLDFLEGLS